MLPRGVQRGEARAVTVGGPRPDQLFGSTAMIPVPPGLRRLRRGRGFTYVDESGERLSAEESDRVRALRISPAWKDVLRDEAEPLDPALAELMAPG